MPLRVERILPCALNQDDLNEVSKQLAANIETLNQERETFKGIAADYRARFRAFEDEQLKMSRIIETEREDRTVICEWHFDNPEIGLKTLIRTDTGETVQVDSMSENDRAAAAAERQTELNFDTWEN